MASFEGVNLCPPPFFESSAFTKNGYVDGRFCQRVSADLECCLPCPMTDWVYPDNFRTITLAADWVAVCSMACCLFLLASWAALPVEKTGRHYLSVCLAGGVLLMNLGFVIPLAAQPEQCYDEITPHDMKTSTVCGASGIFLLLGGWCAVMWAFLRSLSLHLQICWQVVVGRNFMIFTQVAGWGVPVVAIVLEIVFSGVSFRFGPTCHINHENSLATLWIPLLVFAGLTVICTFVTFGYCVKVYLESLADAAASTEGSGLPEYTNSVRATLTPRQAYRRIRRVVSLQWRGIAIVLIIIADVIFFSIVFVFQDNVLQAIKAKPIKAEDWLLCLIESKGDKLECLDEVSSLVVNEATVSAVLLLLGLNGLWAILLMGRWSMLSSWFAVVAKPFKSDKKEFLSVDARFESKHETRAYEMLSRESSAAVTPVSPVKSQPSHSGRRTPDYFGQTARYQPPVRSYSSPRAPQRSWATQQTLAPSQMYDVHPLGMNKT